MGVKNRIAKRGDCFYIADHYDPLIIKKVWILSNPGEKCEYRNGCVQAKHTDQFVPEYFADTPQEAFAQSIQRRVDANIDLIEQYEKKILNAINEIDRLNRLGIEDIKINKESETFEENERNWWLDY